MFLKSILAHTSFLFLLASTASVSEALPVKNFSQVGGTETLLRGAQPGKSAGLLRDLGVDAVLIFKSDTRGEVTKEVNALLSSGLKESDVHHIPMAWKDLDLGEACLQTVGALEILSRAVADGKTVFFHCTAGEDRTGMLAGLNRVLHENADVEQMFEEELCKKGYSNGNPGKPKIVIDQIESGLTPLYFALAEKIAAAKSSGRKIGPGLCRVLNPQPVARSCRSIN
jgi:hypothetical protein